VSLWMIDNADRLRWVLIHALEQLLPENRAGLVRAVIPRLSDISVLCDLVRTIAGDRNPNGERTERELSGFGELTDTIRDELLGRVRYFAQTNQIWSQSQPNRIIWFWWGCDLETEVRNFTNVTMDTYGGLRGLLKATVSLVRSSGGDYEHVHVPTWSKVVDIDKLAARARSLMSGSDETDRHLAERFLRALDRGKDSPF
jgi:hypothetical protein